MAKSKKVTQDKSDSKKSTRKQIEKKLETALGTLKPLLGEKKFRKRIKKAGKVLTDGIKGKMQDIPVDSNHKSNAKKTEDQHSSVKSNGIKHEHVVPLQRNTENA